ncbi:MAG: AmmeMemoRadiSam system protein B [Candidatus Magasanikbacteria bacterium RIFCSPLOWO2_01_FULL_43_20b]|nr:MAG: AmmeMemoRadiSam system protein B [Candidatus Magasanikbacteria bacterium RIFCSPLOWO2_02_FULL_43_22]OGH73067.1 MAG: AmmeMemoRadiSam system protein B [Candidatus Magasanikbacteria bacterium RIFCSPLOWO2_01_FULL_43_20b]
MLNFFLPLILLFIAGCSSASFVYKNTSQVIDEENKQYQYSAPWDKKMFESFYQSRKDVGEVGEVKGAIIPHHLLSGYMPATLFDYLKKQNPSTIVLVGPNHFGRGYSNIITSDRDWKTPFGIIKTDHNLISVISGRQLVGVDESTMKEEHSIYPLVSFIAKSLPDAKVVPIILKNNTKNQEMDELVRVLEKELPKDAVVISSIDFSHYQPAPVSAFHDELSEAVIKNFDFSRLSKLEIDSIPSLYVLLRLMEKFGAQKPVYEMYDNPGQTSHYSVWFGNGDRSENKTASVLFFGDMMLDRNVTERVKENDGDWLFSALAGEENRFFSGMDEVHANLEGPFADSRRDTGKSIAFRFDPALISTLKKYNFSIFNLANNHSLDMGQAGFAESKINLEKAGIDFYGDSYGISDDALKIKQIGGLDIAFLGLNDTFSPLPTDKIVALIKQAEKSADFTIVNIHWGDEYKFLKSNARQQKLAREMIDAGADIIIGHHPHVAQEMEIYKNKPIFYSLGNFIFDQYFSTETQQGLAVGLVMCKGGACPAQSTGGAGGQSVYVFPLQSVQSQVKLMSGDYLNSFFVQFIQNSRLGDNKFNNFNIKLN